MAGTMLVSCHVQEVYSDGVKAARSIIARAYQQPYNECSAVAAFYGAMWPGYSLWKDLASLDSLVLFQQ